MTRSKDVCPTHCRASCPLFPEFFQCWEVFQSDVSSIQQRWWEQLAICFCQVRVHQCCNLWMTRVECRRHPAPPPTAPGTSTPGSSSSKSLEVLFLWAATPSHSKALSTSSTSVSTTLVPPSTRGCTRSTHCHLYAPWVFCPVIPGLTQPFCWEVPPLDGVAKADVLQDAGKKQLWERNHTPSVNILLCEHCIEE
jgi:hypothetical protein